MTFGSGLGLKVQTELYSQNKSHVTLYKAMCSGPRGNFETVRNRRRRRDKEFSFDTLTLTDRCNTRNVTPTHQAYQETISSSRLLLRVIISFPLFQKLFVPLRDCSVLKIPQVNNVHQN